MLNLMSIKCYRAFLTVALLAISQAAFANVVTFTIDWTSPGTAQAEAVLVMDTGYIRTSTGPALQTPMSDVISFSMSVTGAAAGNGTFGMSDFSSLHFYSNGALNYSGQLIGQTQPGNGLQFGRTNGQGLNGGFSLGASSATAPGTVEPFEMVTNWNTNPSDLLVVSSIIATPSLSGAKLATPVPEESTCAMLLAGMGLAGYMARRKRQ